MQRKLKSLLRKSTSRKGHSDQAPRPATSHGHPSSADTCPEDHRQSARRKSLQATDSAMASAEEIDPAIADNYRAYLPAIASDEGFPADPRYMTLGGDTRYLVGESEMKHSENIADRNIDMYGGSNSRHASLPSQTDINIVNEHIDQTQSNAPAQHNSLRKGSVGYSSSPGYAHSMCSTGFVTEGGLVDSIRPHKETTPSQNYNRKDWPTRIARDDIKKNTLRRKPVRGTNGEMPHIRRPSVHGSVSSSQSDQSSSKRETGLIDLRTAVMDGQYEDTDHYHNDVARQLDGVIDINDTEDVDKTTRIAPAVTHEIIKPHEHEIVEERIYREIHNHDVYHRIQPLYHTDILPPRHFVHDASGNLVEVAEDQIPNCTGDFQRWYMGKKESPTTNTTLRMPRVTEPRMVSDTTYMTPEGFERRETTIVHPPELEDMSGYGGPVIPIEFFHDIAPSEGFVRRKDNPNHVTDSHPMSLNELSEAMPAT